MCSGLLSSTALLVVVLPCTAVAIEDPTRPPTLGEAVGPAVAAAAPQLKSILVSAERRLALIDDVLLAEGERGAEIELLRIDANAVVVRTRSGERLTLTMGGNKVHRQSR